MGKVRWTLRKRRVCPYLLQMGMMRIVTKEVLKGERSQRKTRARLLHQLDPNLHLLKRSRNSSSLSLSLKLRRMNRVELGLGGDLLAKATITLIKHPNSSSISSSRVEFRLLRIIANEIVVVVGQLISAGILRTMLVRTLCSVAMASPNLLHQINQMMAVHHEVAEVVDQTTRAKVDGNLHRHLHLRAEVAEVQEEEKAEGMVMAAIIEKEDTVEEADDRDLEIRSLHIHIKKKS